MRQTVCKFLTCWTSRSNRGDRGTAYESRQMGEGLKHYAGLEFDGGTAAICRRAVLTGRDAL